MITITSKKEGFRRGGIAHSQTPTQYEDDFFTAAELKVLRDEGMLTVVKKEDAHIERKHDDELSFVVKKEDTHSERKNKIKVSS